MKVLILLAALAATALARPTIPNIVQLAESVPDLSTLVTAVEAAGLVDTLSGPGPFTVFAPTNEAFAALGAATVANLLKPENKALLVDILTYHVVAARALSSDLTNGESIPTVEGTNVTAHVVSSGVYINGAQVVKANVLASNGVVHIINRVILPAPAPGTQNIVQLAEATADLSTLVQAVVAGGLANTLSGPGPFTVFAPTNEAFAALGPLLPQLLKPENKAKLVQILTYHVVAARAFSTDIFNTETIPTVEGSTVAVTINSNGVYINKAHVVDADINASNGVVHVIDAVLVPASELLEIAQALGVKAAPTENIVQLAESVPDLSILVKAVVAAGLADTLSGPGPFTVFAPTNEAFEALGADTLNNLLKPENKALLVDILTYHVVAGRALSTDLKDGESIPTVEGTNVTAHVQRSGIYINGAQVIKANVLATNGVVHIIDRVILPAPAPGNLTIVQLAESVPQLSTLVQAVVAAGLADTLSGPGPFTVFAPTNEAFAALGHLLPELLKPENKAKLVKVLTYHVVAGRAFSSDIFNTETIATVEGKPVIVSVVTTGIYIDRSRVIQADVNAYNGVVHVIDAVLIPSDL